MKTENVWSERLPPKDSYDSIVFDMCYRPDGSQIICAVGSRILVFDAETGDLQHSLKGHKDYVYTVSYSRDNKRFASGGADRTIIIWTHKCEGILKYSHNDSIQQIAFNPITSQLASATQSDFGLWSAEAKSVQKHKVQSKILCLSWTNDGLYLALGQYNGVISIRDKSGNEKVRIERSQPIWTMQWSPLTAAQQHHTVASTATDRPELLCVGCWDQTMSFYDISGTQQGKDRVLGYDPCSITFYGDGEYILAGGSDRKVSIYTRDGVFLKVVTEREDWVWAIRSRPKSKHIAVGCNDGNISVHQTTFSTVHGLYQDRYAHRDTITDVIIQHLMTEQKVRIKTRDYVKKIAVYKQRLAVQLPDRVLIYETSNDNSDGNISTASSSLLTDQHTIISVENDNNMHYRLKEKIMKQLDCNLLVVTSENIILCQEKKLQLFNFIGKKVREWVLDAVIRYIRVVGGPIGREGLLVGLKNGSVYKIFIDNRFPVKLIQHNAPIRCLDLSHSRTKLAVVDEQSHITVYNLINQNIIFEENNANSVAWNSEMEDMLCYSGNGFLCIKTGDFPLHKQPLQGFVVGFKGSKIFCLHYLSMQTIDVPQSASLYRYLDTRDYTNAYNVACLGVTETDWREFAIQCLLALQFHLARKAFIRIRDVRYIELLNRIEASRRTAQATNTSQVNDELYLAEIHAFQGNYIEAARLYVKNGQAKKAIEMYLDLREWEKAKEIVESSGQSLDTNALMAADGSSQMGEQNGLSMGDLLKAQAEWLIDTNDQSSAAEMYWTAKDYTAAINILGTHGWYDKLNDRAKTLHVKTQKTLIELSIDWLKKGCQWQFAKDLLIKIDQIPMAIEILVNQQQWNDAIQLAQDKPEFASAVYLPYAAYLCMQDRFDEAQDAFDRAGRPMESQRIILQLITAALSENRYNDAAYYHYLLAKETAKHAAMPKSSTAATTAADAMAARYERVIYTKRYDYHIRLAELYHAYYCIYRYTAEPFTSLTPDTLFNTAQFIINNTQPSMMANTNAVLASQQQGNHTSNTSTSTALTSSKIPNNMSLASTLFALAKQAKILGAYKLARAAYTRLLSLRLPYAWRDQVELSALIIRGLPFVDKESLLPVCYRCSTSNPLMTITGDRCINCSHLFQRSFIGFETLPLVRFVLAEGISDEEAEKLIAQEPNINSNEFNNINKRSSKTSTNENIQTLNFDDDNNNNNQQNIDTNIILNNNNNNQENFQLLLERFEANSDGIYTDIIVDRYILNNMKSSEVFIKKFPYKIKKNEYYYSLISDLPIIICHECGHLFHYDDYTAYVLLHSNCPFCRTSIMDKRDADTHLHNVDELTKQKNNSNNNLITGVKNINLNNNNDKKRMSDTDSAANSSRKHQPSPPGSARNY